MRRESLDFDDELPDRLREGVNGLRPDVSRLVAGGLERGKRLVRWRRIVQVAAAGAAAAVLSGVAYASPWIGAGGQNGQFQVAAPPTTEAAVKPPPKPPAKPELADITPQAALQLLLDQLPDGVKTGEYEGGGGRSDDPPGLIIQAKLKYIERDAVTHMTVGFSTTDDGSQKECGEVAPGDSCAVEQLPDGSTFRLAKHRAPGPDGVVNWFATLTRPDGVQILVIEGNAPEKELVPPSRAVPPLSEEQLEAILTSPVWQPELDADYVARAESLFEPKK